jgi:hypothetical protein
MSIAQAKPLDWPGAVDPCTMRLRAILGAQRQAGISAGAKTNALMPYLKVPTSEAVSWRASAALQIAIIVTWAAWQAS